MRRIGPLWLVILSILLSACSLESQPTLQPTDPPISSIEEPVLADEPEGPPEVARPPLNLTFVGDIMLARIPGQAVEAGLDPFAGTATALDQGDLTIGNLECVVATIGERVPKSYNFRCHPRILPYLARYFDAVSVANNHSGDFGKGAFVEELDLLTEAKVTPFGGGRNEAEAYQPVILTKNGWRVALIGVDGVELFSYAARGEEPGVAWLFPERIAEIVRAVRPEADVVIVLPHWGYEYMFTPAREHEAMAHLWLESGADMVIGTHPHVIQPIHSYKGKLIAYSLGNYVFDDFMDVSAALDEPSRLSWILQVMVATDGEQRWTVQTARTDDQGLPQLVSNDRVPCEVGAPECRPQPK